MTGPQLRRASSSPAPRPAAAPGRPRRPASTTSSSRASGASSRRSRRGPRTSASMPGTTASPIRRGSGSSLTSSTTRRTSRRSRRWTRRRCPRRRDSSATWSSTTSASGSSAPRRSGPGSAARRARRRSATRCSPCSRATSRRCPSASQSIAARLEAAPRFLAGYRSRAVGAQVRPWLEIELRASANVPPFLDEIVAAADLAGASVPRPSDGACGAAIDGAKVAIEDQAEWIEEILPGATPEWPLGARALRRADRACARSTASTPTRSSRSAGSSSSGTTPTGGRSARDRSRRRREMEVVERVKDDHPTTFEEALDGYRDAMAARPRAPGRARPRDRPGRRAGRGHRDAPSTCAASCPSPRTSSRPAGIPRRSASYVVTPSVDERPRRDARALPRRDQQHQHPRGVPGPPPAARPRGAAPVADPRPGRRDRSSSRAGACTASR